MKRRQHGMSAMRSMDLLGAMANHDLGCCKTTAMSMTGDPRRAEALSDPLDDFEIEHVARMTHRSSRASQDVDLVEGGLHDAQTAGVELSAFMLSRTSDPVALVGVEG